jgi:hypothetical protein
MVCAHRQRGQIAPVALIGVLIASAALVLFFNTAQQVTERSQLVNAADAAAYSGAVWTARHLNFMAYTNRAMVANHAAVGHLVSYVSWVRYVHDSIDYVDRVTQWLPAVAPYIDAAERVAEQVRYLAEQSAEIAIPAIDAWNATFRAAQAEAQASLALNNLTELMQATAASYDSAIRLNDRGELGRMPQELRTLLEAQLLPQLAQVPTFVQRYTASDDHNSVNELIDASLRADQHLARWIPGERGWQESGILFRLRKLGATAHHQDSDGADWQASDQLEYRTRRLLGWSRWRRLGPHISTASAREFEPDYAGVPAYYNVAGAPGQHSLQLIALATKRQTQVATADLLGLSPSGLPLSAVAVARVEFKRPRGEHFPALAPEHEELANLFNPFWEARLAPASFGGAL